MLRLLRCALVARALRTAGTAVVFLADPGPPGFDRAPLPLAERLLAALPASGSAGLLAASPEWLARRPRNRTAPAATLPG